MSLCYVIATFNFQYDNATVGTKYNYKVQLLVHFWSMALVVTEQPAELHLMEIANDDFRFCVLQSVEEIVLDLQFYFSSFNLGSSHSSQLLLVVRWFLLDKAFKLLLILEYEGWDGQAIADGFKSVCLSL